MRLWVSEDRTVLVREYEDGYMEVATRPEAGAIWGPPIEVREDKPQGPGDPGPWKAAA